MKARVRRQDVTTRTVLDRRPPPRSGPAASAPPDLQRSLRLGHHIQRIQVTRAPSISAREDVQRTKTGTAVGGGLGSIFTGAVGGLAFGLPGLLVGGLMGGLGGGYFGSRKSEQWLRESVLRAFALDDGDALGELLDGYPQIDLDGDFGGRRLLFDAIGADLMEVIPVLIDHDIDLEAEDDEGNRALHLAAADLAFETALEKCQLLIDGGAELDAIDANGKTALLIAAEEGNADVVDALAQAGADVDAKNEDGETALHLATAGDYPKVLEVLVGAGAKVDQEDDEGRLPLERSESAKTRDEVRKGYEQGVKDVLLLAFGESLKSRQSTRVPLIATMKPSTLAKKLNGLVDAKYASISTALDSALDEASATIAKRDVAFHKDLVGEERSTPLSIETGKLKFLSHVYSLKGKEQVGWKRDLEGFSSEQAVFHLLLALQSALRNIAQKKGPKSKEASAIRTQMNIYLRTFERAVEFQMVRVIFDALDLRAEASELVAGSIAEEMQNNDRTVLPAGWSGDKDESGHAVYVAIDSEEASEDENDTYSVAVHNLGAYVSSHHEVDPERRRLDKAKSYFPRETYGVEQEDVGGWLKSMILATLGKSDKEAERILYTELPKLGGQSTGLERDAEITAQKQQTVGNCAVKNLTSTLLTDLQERLGKSDGRELYDQLKREIRDFAETYARQGAKKNGELSQAIDRMLSRNLQRKRLFSAVGNPDLTKLRKVLSELDTGLLEATDDDGKTPLVLALELQNPDAALLLAKKGARADAIADSPYATITVLEAAKSNNHRLIAALLDRGMSVDLHFKDVVLGKIASKSKEMVQVLFRHGSVF